MIESRQKIDILHQELFSLLNQRMGLVEKIWQHKKTEHLNEYDHQRELDLIHQFDNTDLARNNPEFRAYYQAIVKSILAETKKYLHSQKKPD